MYPYKIIFGMDLYEIFLCVGIIAAMLTFRHFSDGCSISPKLHNFVLYNAIVTVTGGYLASVGVQAIYNWLDGDPLTIDSSTGATFLGGLAGGALVFILVYFAVGHFVFRKHGNEHLVRFLSVAEIAGICIPAAHACGRLGCLMAGCCYGKVFDSPRWYTFSFPIISTGGHVLGYRYALPTQLYESMFLFILAGVLWYRLTKGKKNILGSYMIAYGVWRFFAEYLRGDDRGSTVVSFLSPSQFVSVFLVIGGIVLCLIPAYRRGAGYKRAEKEGKNE